MSFALFIFLLALGYTHYSVASAPIKNFSTAPAITPTDSSFSVKIKPSTQNLKYQSTLIVDLGKYKELKYIKIYDLTGKKVLFQHLPYSNKIVKINMASLRPGIYFCSVFSSKGLVETRKVISF